MLSKTENEVYDLVKTGISNKEISERLFVTDKTVKFHLTNIYKKLGVKTRAELIAKNYGLVPPPKRGERPMSEIEVLPSKQGRLATGVPSKTQEEKISFIDEKFRVGETIGQLHGMMKEVTKDEITPNTVNAACNCVARLNETINTAIQAARFLNER